jgi:hypothetical protein
VAREAAEQAARDAERARDEAERLADEAQEASAVKFLQTRRSGLLPPPESRLRLGPVSARMVPTEPRFHGTEKTSQQDQEAATVAENLARFEAFATARVASGILGGVALAGLGAGGALFFIPGGGLDGSPDSQSYRTAGLTAGIIGVVAAVAALAVLPAEPPLGLAVDPLRASRR